MERGDRDERKSECEGGEDKHEGGREYHTLKNRSRPSVAELIGPPDCL